MADLEYSPLLYEEGSPYPPMAFNRVSQLSAVHYAAALIEHTDEGEHKPPFVAKAAAVVLWNGTAYSLGPSKNVSSVTRVGAGEIEIQLANSMSSADRWGVIGWMEWHSEAGPTGETLAEVHGSKTANKVRVRIPIDNGFVFFAMDQR